MVLFTRGVLSTGDVFDSISLSFEILYAGIEDESRLRRCIILFIVSMRLLG